MIRAALELAAAALATVALFWGLLIFAAIIGA